MQLILWKLESLRQWEKDSITATFRRWSNPGAEAA
jgi:hypothetical protein